MKRASKAVSHVSEDLRSEYAFDYSQAKKNPYAARQGRTVAVVLEPDEAVEQAEGSDEAQGGTRTAN